MEQILDYLVALTRPLRHDERTLPGWWVSHAPERLTSAAYAGHGNFGAAHGITGPLALLAQAARRGLIVKGHREAIETIFTFMDSWRQDSPAGSWWPGVDHRRRAGDGALQASRPRAAELVLWNSRHCPRWPAGCHRYR
ncbi:lanthionine synthetase LanC family protein [Catenulispora yoronensis]